MRWSWKLGTVFGIGIYLHGTFLILLAWIALSHLLQGDPQLEALLSMLFIILLFGIIVLHELGHALAARRFGIKTRDITLLPIGGVARLERMPEDPKQELVVAMAGPAVNVVLALALWLSLVASGHDSALSEVSLAGAGLWSFLARLMWVNVGLVVFNMLPAFPMDGGRVVRALLAMRLDYFRATQIAATLGQAMALLFAFFGFVFNPFLIFIAMFVWLGAAAELSAAQVRTALSGVPLRMAMITDFRTLAPGDLLSFAVNQVIGGFQHDFPVVDQGRLIGVVSYADLSRGLTELGAQARVEQIMERQFPTADPFEMLERAFTRLQNSKSHSLPVVSNGTLVGLLTLENVMEFISLKAAYQGSKA